MQFMHSIGQIQENQFSFYTVFTSPIIQSYFNTVTGENLQQRQKTLTSPRLYVIVEL